MDYGNPNQNQGAQPPYQFEQTAPPPNSMATAASVLGLATIVSTILCTVYIPFITGALAILFAILSKGRCTRMNGPATTGMATAAAGLVMNVTLIVTSIVLYLTVPEVREQANEVFEQRYGVTMEEMWDELNNNP